MLTRNIHKGVYESDVYHHSWGLDFDFGFDFFSFDLFQKNICIINLFVKMCFIMPRYCLVLVCLPTGIPSLVAHFKFSLFNTKLSEIDRTRLSRLTRQLLKIASSTIPEKV